MKSFVLLVMALFLVAEVVESANLALHFLLQRRRRHKPKPQPVQSATQRRKLQEGFSQQCTDAIADLSKNEEFQAANATKMTEIEAIDPNSLCNLTTDTLYTCNVDYSTLPSAAAFVLACDGAGGRMVPIGLTVSCKGKTQETVDNTVEFIINDQECLPSPACSEAEIDSEAELAEQRVGEEMQSAVQGDCTINLDNQVMTEATSAGSSLPLTTTALAAFLTLGFFGVV